MAEKRRGPGRPPGSKNKTQGKTQTKAQASRSTRSKTSNSRSKTTASRSRSTAKSQPNTPPVESRVKDEIAAIVLLALGAFIAVAIQTNFAGAVGKIIDGFLKGMFGFGAYFMPYIMIIYAALMFAKLASSFRGRTIGLLVLLFLMIDLLCVGHFIPEMKYGILGITEVYHQSGQLVSGGVFGMYVGLLIYKLIGVTGLYILAILMIIVCLLLLVNTPISKFMEVAKARKEARKERKNLAMAEAKAQADALAAEQEELAQKRSAVESAGRQMDMDYKPPSERAKILARYTDNQIDMFSKDKEEKYDPESIYVPPIDPEIVRPSNKAKSVRADKPVILPSMDHLPDNQKNILEMMQDSSIFEDREMDKGFGLDGSEPSSIRQPEPRIEPEEPEEINITDYSQLDLDDDFDGFVKRDRPLDPVDMTSLKEGEVTGFSEGPLPVNGSATPVSNVEPMAKTGESAAPVVIGGESIATAASLTEKNSSEVGVTPRKRSRYKLPPMELLNDPKIPDRTSENRENLAEKAALLEATLQSFNVEAKVVNVISGPSVTRYEIEPARGVKVQSITRLADDLALNMRAKSIRIEAPIPGKAAVGIEIENESRQMVSIKEIIGSREFRDHKSKLAFAVGRDIGGKAVVADLGKMPHMLIAGATGSGKSVCINTIIASILYKARPEEVKMVLIDPKMVELGNYNGIPHLLIPVVTDSTKAAAALQWAVAEMTDRYKKFASEGVRDIGSYNTLMKEQSNQEDILPQIVIIIDELADLMMVASSQVEDAICRLAQLARAAGMHLILATQRPSVDVITGLIKANVPSRIAFMVSSQIDSRTIIDMAGAEKLVGNGDMLFKPQDLNKPKRIQGPFVSDGEVEKIISFVKSQVEEPEYNENIIEQIEKGKGGDLDTDGDDLLDEAVETVISAGQASVSMLQRRFRIGYNRAARIIDNMEAQGIIGPQDGSRPRQVLITLEQWQERKDSEI